MIFFDHPGSSIRLVSSGFLVAMLVFEREHSRTHEANSLLSSTVIGLIGAVIIATVLFGIKLTLPGTFFATHGMDTPPYMQPGIFSQLRKNMRKAMPIDYSEHGDHAMSGMMMT